MIEFILNDKLVISVSPPTNVLLDFLRKERKLIGTKEGCREGDCGACTILLGEAVGNKVKYKTVNSCLMPLGDVHGKHVVTIEGLTGSGLTKIQESMVNEGGTQCGFCTPGFIVSLTGYFLNTSSPDYNDAVDYLGGNICRCTGYSGIKRAVEQLLPYFKTGKPDTGKLISLEFIPAYFSGINKQLKNIKPQKTDNNKSKSYIAGGTDLYVQKWEAMISSGASLISEKNNLHGISLKGKKIILGAAVTIEEIRQSEIIQKFIPEWKNYLNLFGSLPIRNRATVGGNLVNASPIGDMPNILLALDGEVHIASSSGKKVMPLKNFYKGYKQLNKKDTDIVEAISFTAPVKKSFFNYEKVSKRTYLDIASVNSSFYAEVKNGKITSINISAGGVAPVPLYLSGMCTYLHNKQITNETVKEAVSVALKEIAPISDARGTAEYKKLLLRQLLYIHFIKLFPELINAENLL